MESKNIEKFYEKLNQFYDLGILRNVYSDDNTIACSCFNQYYVVFNLNVQKQFDSNFVGLITNSFGLKSTISDSNFLLNCFKFIPKADNERYMFILNDAFLKDFLSKKSECEQLEPSSNVDLELEEQIRKNNVK